MPSHKIHIKIGDEINKVLNLDVDLFKIGCILPDLSEKVPHYKSHFKTNKKNHLFYNCDLFLKKYKIKNNPVLTGYLVHLLTDYYYNNYVRNNYYLFDDNHKLNGIKLKDKKYYCTPNEVTIIKQKEFTMYDNYLVKNKSYKEFTDFNLINKLPKIYECDYDKNYIIEYMNLYNEAIKKNNFYEKEIVFNFMTKEELDELFKNCVKFILDYLKNVD